MKIFAVIISLIALVSPLFAQSGIVSHYPLEEYVEPRVGELPDSAAWSVLPQGLNLTWASRDIHYKLHQVPQVTIKKDTVVYGWRGERLNVTALIYSKSPQGVLSLRMSPLSKDGIETDISAASSRFVNYVITDDYNMCGYHPKDLPAWLSPDIIDLDLPKEIKAMETRPVWCSVEIPREIEPGEYSTRLEVLNIQGDVVDSLLLKINVLDMLLPEPSEQRFHLDLWQQPYAVSRYHGVQRWSQGHLNALRPYLEALAKAGQKSITAIMFYEPWGEQTHEKDKFDPMIETYRNEDGTWDYDYTNFDKYVELCHQCGITGQINCYSMVPWDMNFRYYDREKQEYKFLKTNTSAEEYVQLWTKFLLSFKEHLLEKGWFEKTNIAMDERSESDMLNAYQIASSIGFDVALAGNYHSSLCDKLQDYCVAFGQDKYFTKEELEGRKQRGQITTIYTCCADKKPNIYTNSFPVEGAFIPIYAAANNMDGYLHWSWINWHENPLEDSRYRMFGSGDTYFYYPGNRSSVRFERLVEGIQQYEKIMIFRELYGDDSVKMCALNTLLNRTNDRTLSGIEYAKVVDDIEAFLNGILDESLIPEGILFNTSGGDGVQAPYRIPALAVANNGSVIAVAAKLVCGTDPGFGKIDLVGRISYDNGKSWSKMDKIATGSGKTSPVENFFDTAFGDPAIVADRKSGKVLLLSVAGCTLYPSPNTNRSNPNLIAISRSEDNGESWSEPKDITEQIYSLFDTSSPLDAAFVTSGRLFQSRVIKKGKYYRIYAALCARPGGNRVLYSDDFGESWNPLGGASALPVPEGNEAKCEELPDGTVIISSRTTGGRLFNFYTYKNIAKGEGKWSNVVKCDFESSGVRMGENSTNGEMIVVPVIRVSDNKEVNLLLHSIPFSDSRENVGIYYAELPESVKGYSVEDLTNSWKGHYQVSETTSAYSSVDLQADGKIAILYEENYTWFGWRANPVSTTFPKGEGSHNYDGYDIVYKSFTVEEITKGAYKNIVP